MQTCPCPDAFRSPDTHCHASDVIEFVRVAILSAARLQPRQTRAWAEVTREPAGARGRSRGRRTGAKLWYFHQMLKMDVNLVQCKSYC